MGQADGPAAVLLPTRGPADLQHEQQRQNGARGRAEERSGRVGRWWAKPRMDLFVWHFVWKVYFSC